MKKFILILVLAVVAMAANAQNKVTEVDSDGYINGASYAYIGGEATLTDAETLTYVLRVKGSKTMDIKAQIYNEFVSGTATGKLKSYKSIDGITYVVTAAADSITVASVTADILDSEELSFSDVLYPYLKFVYIQAGSGANIPRIYIYAKEN